MENDKSPQSILATINTNGVQQTSWFDLRDFDEKPYIVVRQREENGSTIQSRIYLDKQKIQDLADLKAGLNYQGQLSSSEVVNVSLE